METSSFTISKRRKFQSKAVSFFRQVMHVLWPSSKLTRSINLKMMLLITRITCQWWTQSSQISCSSKSVRWSSGKRSSKSWRVSSIRQNAGYRPSSQSTKRATLSNLKFQISRRTMISETWRHDMRISNCRKIFRRDKTQRRCAKLRSITIRRCETSKSYLKRSLSKKAMGICS